MKPFIVRTIPSALITLFYLLFFALNTAPWSNHLNPYPRHTSEGTLRNSSYSLNDGLACSFIPSLHSRWPHFFTHSASLPARSVSFLKQRAATSLLNNRLHEKRVGGTWHYHLDSLGARNLTLPAIVTFASPPTIKNEYAPLSSVNGYLNSRIDLKQRKRAFHPTPQSTSTSSPVALRFHEGVTLQPRGVSPSGLVDEFRKAMAQNHRLKEASITRRSRKAGRKKLVKVA